MQKLLPVCVFSKLPATKVCLSPSCDEVPFLCSGECVAHACTKLHKHGGQHKLMDYTALMDLIWKLQNPNKVKDDLIQSFTESITQIIQSLKLMIQRVRTTLLSKDMTYRCSSVLLSTIIKIQSKQFSKLTGKELNRLVHSESSENQQEIETKIRIESSKVTNIIESIHELIDYYHGTYDFREKSQRFFNEAVRLSSTNPKDSLAQYSKAIEYNPNNSIAIQGRAQIYSQLQLYDQALKDYQRVLNLDPNNHQSHNAKGMILHDHFSKQKESIKCYTRAIEINPIQVSYYLNRCNAYIEIGNYKMALKDINEIINNNENEAWFYQKRAEIESMLGMSKEATEDQEKAQCLRVSKQQ